MGSSAASKAVPNPLLITSARHGHRPASSGKFITHSNFLGSSTSTLSSSRNWVPPVRRRSSAVSAVSSEVVKEKNVNSASPNLDNGTWQFEVKLKRRLLLSFIVGSSIYPVFPSSSKTKKQNPYDERRLLEQNKRIQRENNVPDDFPNFVREGFAVKVLTSNNYVTRDSGLVLWDIEVGKGDCPKDGQQVTFHYVGYNESGRRIDSTYLQGSPAKVRLGTNALIPGFEEGIRDMKPGGKRRMIIPPELGPPVGPSTFFSSKQFEVFDVELLSIQNCTRRTIGFYSDVVCG